MAIRSILAVASATASDADLLAQGSALSQRLAARLTILPAFPDPAADLVVIGQSLGADLSSAGAAQLAAGEATAYRRVKEEAAIAARRLGLSFGEEDEAVVLRPRTLAPWHALRLALPTSDLVMMGIGAATRGRPLSGMFADALIGARAPVLAVRNALPVLDGLAVIAWDGSLEAGRAVRAAMPLLRQMSRVIVMQDIDGMDWVEREAGDVQRLTAYLAQHEVTQVKVEQVIGVNDGQAIFETAQDRNAHLLVSGAYGHSRLQEAILGGPTRFFLEAERGPHLFLCH